MVNSLTLKVLDQPLNFGEIPTTIISGPFPTEMSPTLQLLPSQLDSMSDHDFVFPTFLFETFRLFRCSLIQCLKGTLGSTRK